MVLAHWLSIIVFYGFSVSRAKSIFSPHLWFSTLLIYLYLLDFALRGYDAKEYMTFGSAQYVVYYQLLVLFICIFTIIVSFFFGERKKIFSFNNLRGSPIGDRELMYIFYFSCAVFFTEIFFRLLSSGFSISDALAGMFGPRFGSEYYKWRTEDTIFGPIVAVNWIVLPLASASFFYVYLSVRGMTSYISLCFGVLSVLILVGGGSRTMVAIPAVVCIATIAAGSYSAWKKIAYVGGVFIVTMIVFSAQYQYRSTGFINGLSKSEGVEFVYHQDNNYYSTVRALERAGYTDQRWDQTTFFVAAAFGWVPRFIWQGKPKLDQAFWGGYKRPWWTIGYIGEAAALFGVYGGALFSVIYGLLMFSILRFSYNKASGPLSLIIYIVMSVYVYMCMRSILNISQWVVLPAVTIFLNYYYSFKSRRAHSAGGGMMKNVTTM